MQEAAARAGGPQRDVGGLEGGVRAGVCVGVGEGGVATCFGAISFGFGVGG